MKTSSSCLGFPFRECRSIVTIHESPLYCTALAVLLVVDPPAESLLSAQGSTTQLCSSEREGITCLGTVPLDLWTWGSSPLKLEVGVRSGVLDLGTDDMFPTPES